MIRLVKELNVRFKSVEKSYITKQNGKNSRQLKALMIKISIRNIMKNSYIFLIVPLLFISHLSSPLTYFFSTVKGCTTQNY